MEVKSWKKVNGDQKRVRETSTSLMILMKKKKLKKERFVTLKNLLLSGINSKVCAAAPFQHLLFFRSLSQEPGSNSDLTDSSLNLDCHTGFFLSREDDGTREQSGGLSISDQEYREYEYGNNNRTVSGNGQVHSYAADLTEAPSEAATDGQRESSSEVGISVEEQWHAHYSRVPRPGVRVRLYPGSIELWDWTTVEQEQKTAKKKKARKLSVRLVGRLAPNSNNLHPSLGGSGGFIRTSPISEVDHEFVKVSSGERQRQKHFLHDYRQGFLVC